MPACRRSVSAPIRSNLVIALGDLSVRFPNTLEPWTAKMYGILEDPHEGAPGTPFVLILGLISACTAASPAQCCTNRHLGDDADADVDAQDLEAATMQVFPAVSCPQLCPHMSCILTRSLSPRGLHNLPPVMHV